MTGIDGACLEAMTDISGRPQRSSPEAGAVSVSCPVSLKVTASSSRTFGVGIELLHVVPMDRLRRRHARERHPGKFALSYTVSISAAFVTGGMSRSDSGTVLAR